MSTFRTATNTDAYREKSGRRRQRGKIIGKKNSMLVFFKSHVDPSDEMELRLPSVDSLEDCLTKRLGPPTPSNLTQFNNCMRPHLSL